MSPQAALALFLPLMVIAAGAPAGFLNAKKARIAASSQGGSEMKVNKFSAVAQPEVKAHPATMYDRDAALKSSMRSMMAEDDADEVWYEGRPQNGLIQTGGSTGLSTDDVYMQESTQALSSALGPRWDSKTLEENADRTTKAFLNGISSPKALGSLHAMMGTMAALR